jgi:archaellum component FlaC
MEPKRRHPGMSKPNAHNPKIKNVHPKQLTQDNKINDLAERVDLLEKEYEVMKNSLKSLHKRISKLIEINVAAANKM